MSFSIGKNIKNLRIENQMTEIELSNLLACSVELIKKWENDIECPNIELLPKIAKIFNVSIDYLTTGKVDPVNNFDELLEKVTKNDDVSKLADNLIKVLDKEYHPLL
ncbi:MAG: helix-turn-helix domain-containing protein, partial [bacterium]|nr:helix-turn-helix domain-containing protein [bacterium]